MTLRRILLAGDFRSDRLGASYERAFRTLGREVIRFDVVEHFASLAWPARNRILHRATIRSLALRQNWSRRFNSDLVDKAKQAGADWVLLLNGEWVMPGTIRKLQRNGSRVAIFHADNPFPPHYANRPETLEAAVEADLYLIWSKRLVSRLTDIGVRKAAFVPFGWDEFIHPFQGETKQGAWPGVVFVGNWDREREGFLENIAAHFPLRIHGTAYWATRSRPNSRVRQCWSGGPLFMADAAHAMREAAISLNLLRRQHIIDGQADGVIMRHFEVPGAGGFLLSTRSSTATELFEEGISGAYFADVDECLSKCQYYLAAVEERLRIVDQAHKAVSDQFKYIDCARIIDSHMSEICA
ncbi:MAG: glycosyltransferase [Betaproteobacteria bacterium]|nr:glycosyltransferase [Betaproteobacteria bacterium]